MALAILQYENTSEGNINFKADIGTNRFYKYAIGKRSELKSGLQLIDAVSYESEILKSPETNLFDSSFPIIVPAALFKNNNQFIQLNSYKNVEGKSPAFSDVVTVFAINDLIDIPILGFAKSINTMYQPSHAPSTYCRSISINYRKAPVSRNMFLEKIVETAGAVAPSLLEVISNLQKDKNNKDITSQLVNIIKNVLEALHQQQQNLPPGSPAVVNSTLAQLSPTLPCAKSFTTSLSYNSLSAKNIVQGVNKAGDEQNVVDRATQDESLFPSAVETLISSILGALLLQAPQLLQMVLDNPLKLMNAVSDRNLVQQQTGNIYLANLISYSNQHAIMDQLINMGEAKQSSVPVAMSFTVSKKISINFIQTDPITVFGKPKFVYQTTAGIKLKLSVKDTVDIQPKSVIPQVIIQLMIKDSITVQLLFEKKFKLKNVVVGNEIALDLTTDELNGLPKNKDLLIGANFIWRSKDTNSNSGTYTNHFISLSDGYILKEMGPAVTEEKPLNDVVEHRVFWHKIWEGGGNLKRWVLGLDSKYLCIYKYNLPTNGRMETRIKIDENAGDEEGRLNLAGKMRTGLEVSPVELNKLLPTISSYPSLDTEQLQALMTDELENEMNQEANVRIEMKGKKGERGVLWVYPELKVHEFILQKVTGINDNGQVMTTTDETVHFPRVSSFHFIGAKTT